MFYWEPINHFLLILQFLFCTVLYCTILALILCIVLYCIVLYWHSILGIVLYPIVLYWHSILCIVLYCIILALYALHYIVLFYIMYYIILMPLCYVTGSNPFGSDSDEERYDVWDRESGQREVEGFGQSGGGGGGRGGYLPGAHQEVSGYHVTPLDSSSSRSYAAVGSDLDIPQGQLHIFFLTMREISV